MGLFTFRKFFDFLRQSLRLAEINVNATLNISQLLKTADLTFFDPTEVLSTIGRDVASVIEKHFRSVRVSANHPRLIARNTGSL